MIEGTLSAETMKEVYGCEEDLGYEAPFTTFTWAHWLEMQTHMLQCLSRYQRAIDRRQPQLALLIIAEMQQISVEMHKEACVWIGLPGPSE